MEENDKYWKCKIKGTEIKSDISLYDLRLKAKEYIHSNQLSFSNILGFFRVKNGKEFYIGKR